MSTYSKKRLDFSTAEPFLARKGWFDNFGKCLKLHVRLTEEAASADNVVASVFPVEFKAVVAAERYKLQLVINADETDLFC